MKRIGMLLVVWSAIVATSTFAEEPKKAVELDTLDPFIASWKGDIIGPSGASFATIEVRWERILDGKFVQGRFSATTLEEKRSFMNIVGLKKGLLTEFRFDPVLGCTSSTISCDGKKIVFQGPPDLLGITYTTNEFKGDSLTIKGFLKKDGFALYEMRLKKIDPKTTAEEVPTK